MSRSTTPGSGKPGQGGDDSARPLLQLQRHVVGRSDTGADGQPQRSVRRAPGGTTQQPSSGSSITSSGRDATGAIVDDRFVCVAFPNGDTTQRPPVPALPAVPTFGEVWNSAHLPPPVVTLDPPDPRHHRPRHPHLHRRADHARDRHDAARLHDDRRRDARPLHHQRRRPTRRRTRARATTRSRRRATTRSRSARSGTAAARLAAPDPPGGTTQSDWGTATITTTRTYPVNEVRSVLQP